MQKQYIVCDDGSGLPKDYLVYSPFVYFLILTDGIA